MIQVRNVRPELHQELVRRARLLGMTLTGYVEEILEREVSTPDRKAVWEEILRRRSTRHSTATREQIVESIRELRGPLPGAG